MEPIDRFNLGAPRADAGERRDLHFDGSRVGEVDGARLEAQFAVPGVGYLLLTTFDCPYEETLVISLWSRELRLLDQRTLGAAYTSGILRDVAMDGPALLFRFPADQLWHLEVRRSLLRKRPRLILRKD